MFISSMSTKVPLKLPRTRPKKIKLLSHFGTGNHKIPPKASVFFLNIKIDMQGKKKNHEAIP